MIMSKRFIISQVVLACFLAVFFAIYLFQKETQKVNLPVLGQVKNFTLIDSRNEPYSLSKLKNKIWIADFFFTTCGDICPVMSKNMADLSRTFDQLEDIKFVSITVNPELDSPQKLAEYAQKFEKGKDNWVFLTGDRQQIRTLLIESFKLGDVKEPIFHSSYFTLVDRNGLIRGYYDGTSKEEIQKLFIDASYLEGQ